MKGTSEGQWCISFLAVWFFLAGCSSIQFDRFSDLFEELMVSEVAIYATGTSWSLSNGLGGQDAKSFNFNTWLGGPFLWFLLCFLFDLVAAVAAGGGALTAAIVVYPQISTFWNGMFSLWSEAQFLVKIQENKREIITKSAIKFCFISIF